MRHLRYLTGLISVIMIAHFLVLNGNDPAGAAPRQQSSTIISDGDFNPTDWTVTVTKIGSPTTLTQQQTTGGNPGNYRTTTDTFPAMGPFDLYTVTTFHLFQGAAYDPSTQGAIDHLDYQEDNLLASFSPAHNSPQVRGYFVIEQNGTIFAPFAFSTINTTTWQTYSSTGLQANQFYMFDNPIEGVHPDFSAQGAPITFGYARYRDRNANNPPDVPVSQELIYEHGIDNWQVTIHPATANRPPVAVDDYIVIDVPSSIKKIGEELFIQDAFGVTGNDTDPDTDPFTYLTVTQVSSPTYGTAAVLSNNLIYDISYMQKYGLGGWPDSFSYTVSDGELSDVGAVTLFPDCGCVLSCYTLSVGGYSQEATLDLLLIYRLRDQVMKPTFHGKRYIDMYYDTTPEIVRILMLDQTSLGDEAVSVVELWQNNLYSLVDGDGSAIITQAQVDAIKTFLTNLSAAGSAELQQLIADELARLGPLDDYVGLTVKEAKSKAIGDPITYLPLIVK